MHGMCGLPHPLRGSWQVASAEEVGTGSQNHMTYEAWNANFSSGMHFFASWQFLAGVCWAVSRDLGTSGQVCLAGHLKDSDR